MAEAFTEMLTGARNELGRTEEVVAVVLDQPDRIEELYQCFFQSDEWVRLRTASAFKRIWRADVDLFLPYLDGFVRHVSKIVQPSIQWTFAEMCSDLNQYLSGMQRRSAKARVKKYVEGSNDWIVLNRSIAALDAWSVDDEKLKAWLVPKLEDLADDERKSVAARARKTLDRLVEAG